MKDRKTIFVSTPRYDSNKIKKIFLSDDNRRIYLDVNGKEIKKNPIEFKSDFLGEPWDGTE